jgi:hypothetical protein
MSTGRRGLAVRLDISSVMTTNSSSYCRMSTGRRGLAVRLDISSVLILVVMTLDMSNLTARPRRSSTHSTSLLTDHGITIKALMFV